MHCRKRMEKIRNVNSTEEYLRKGHKFSWVRRSDGVHHCWGESLKVLHMGVSMCHVGFLLSFSRELGLMAVKVAQVVLDFTTPETTISFFHFPQQLFTYLWTHLSSAPTQPQYACGRRSHLWAPHSQGTLCSRWSENSGAWRIMITTCVLPHLTCTASEGSAIHPFLTEPALCGNEGSCFCIKCSNNTCTKCISLLIQYILLKTVTKMGLHPVLMAPYTICISYLFGFFHYKQDFLQWCSWAGKKEIQRQKRKNIREETEFHFSPALLELQHLYLHILDKCLTFSLFLHLLFSQFRFPLSVLLHVFR